MESKAKAFAQSYADAMALGAVKPALPLKQIAEALFSHYTTAGFVVFSMGQTSTMGDAPTEVPRMEAYLNMWCQNGLALDIRLDKLRIEVVSDYGEQGGGSACCFLTWKIYPPPTSAVEGWSWENMYAYRMPPASAGGDRSRGYWEFVVSDNEVAELLKRFPKWFEELRV